jgi:hypothetical protein
MKRGKRKERKASGDGWHTLNRGKTRLQFDDATTLGHWLKYMAISNVKMEQVREQE